MYGKNSFLHEKYIISQLAHVFQSSNNLFGWRRFNSTRKSIDGIASLSVQTDMLTATICIKGQAEGSANLQQIITQPNSFNVILPGQIITHDNQTTDFEARHIIMSSKFVDTLNFTSQDVFSKYFKHHIGTTPKEYRKN